MFDRIVFLVNFRNPKPNLTLPARSYVRQYLWLNIPHYVQ